MPEREPPAVIQGGMGVGVSGWRLARAVSRAGQLGVVSGVALDTVLARRLERGDPGGHARRALARLPLPGVAARILHRYFVPDGIKPGTPFRPVPRIGLRPSAARTELTVAGNFVEVWLAKEDHDGLVGVNYLEKIQMATAPAAYGAMLAGVDYLLVGAGIPGQIPALLDALAANQTAELSVTVEASEGRQEAETMRFDPVAAFGPGVPWPRRPKLLAIVSSAVLAAYLARSPATRPDGYVLETAEAGGHSAPPRGKMQLDERGEPVYGPRDGVDVAKVRSLGLPFWLAGGHADPQALTAARAAVRACGVDVAKVRSLGLPFWLAGGHADPQALTAARAAGAVGVQVGSAFALCQESDMDPDLKRALIERALDGALDVRSDPIASPTGFPFKTASMPGTLTDEAVFADRPRRCDLGYLRTAYRTARGGVGYRCPAEPVADYVAKGGDEADTVGRRCLCNALTSTIGYGQTRADGYREPALVTIGKDLGFLRRLLRPGVDGYHAADVVDYLLAT
jgi:NAD(P)H-dependent flavin oxidoreductase YrpB (nitropropane dioxygenase family)